MRLSRFRPAAATRLLAAACVLWAMAAGVASAQPVRASVRSSDAAETSTAAELTAGGKSLAAGGKTLGGGKSLSGKSLGGGLGGLGSLSDPWSFSAYYEAEQSGLHGRLVLTAKIETGYYIFSTTQPKGGPMPTFVSAESPGVSIAGPLVADRDPTVVFDMAGFENVRVEKFYDSVTWTAPLNFQGPVSGDAGEIELSVNGQVCKEACIPIIDAPVSASFKGFYAVEQATGEPYRDPDGHVTWTASLSAGTVAPGSATEILLTGTPDEGYHLYPLVLHDPSVSQRTIIALTQKGTLLAETPSASSQPITVELIPGEMSTTYHRGAVTWTLPLRVPEGYREGVYPITGLVGYQACTDENCDQPLALQFSGEVNVGAAAGEADAVPLAIKEIDYRTVEKADAAGEWVDQTTPTPQGRTLAFLPLLQYFSLAVLGGLILNLMPCVLPVIGLKVMSFVNEAGGDTRRATELNLWYVAGLLSVFVGLAAITIGVRAATGTAFGWGEQMQSLEVRVALVVLFFVLALSFLGVWEIPVPGFVAGAGGQKHEGPTGAFSKGVITTFAAVPCSGPFLGGVFGHAITQPWWIIAVLYMGVGIGLASPFLLFAADPRLLKKALPKPGAWMETLKQFLAFPMLLAVVWFVSTVGEEYRIALLTLLVFVGFACWLVGRVPAYAEANRRLAAWGGALAVCLIAGYVAFTRLGPQEHLIAWRPYNETELEQLVAEGRPVMLDFTASWCATCKTNLYFAIETEEVAEAVEKYGVVPMLADWSDRNKTIQAKLHELDSNSIPVLAFYPPGEQSQPLVLKDVVTKGMVLEAIGQVAADAPGGEAVAATAQGAKQVEAPPGEPVALRTISDQSDVGDEALPSVTKGSKKTVSLK